MVQQALECMIPSKVLAISSKSKMQDWKIVKRLLGRSSWHQTMYAGNAQLARGFLVSLAISADPHLQCLFLGLLLSICEGAGSVRDDSDGSG